MLTSVHVNNPVFLPTSHTTDLFNLAPALRSIQLEYSLGPRNIVVPWSQLHRIVISNVPYNDIHTILRSGSSLEEAIFHSCSWSHHLNGDVLPDSIIDPPHNDPYESSITDITLGVSATAFLPVYLSFFSKITTPHLRGAKLSYALSGAADQEVLASLHHFWFLRRHDL